MGRQGVRAWVAVLAWLAAGGCGRSQSDPTGGAGFRHLPADQVVLGFEQYITENGRPKAIMRGDTAYVYEDSTLAKIRKVNLTMFDENGNVSGTLTSKSGVLNTFTREMIARGNVVLTTAKDNQQIETEELHYNPNTHRVWSTVRTTQRRGGGVITGTGFEADDKFYNVKVTGARSTGGGFKITF